MVPAGDHLDGGAVAPEVDAKLAAEERFTCHV